MAVGAISKNEQSSRLSQAMKGREPEKTNQSQKKQTKKTEKQQGGTAQGMSANKPKGTEETRDKSQAAKANASRMSAKGSNVDKVA